MRSVCLRLRAALIPPSRHQRGRPWRPTARRSRHSWLRPGESGQRTEPGDAEGQQRWLTRLRGLGGLWPWQRRGGVDRARDGFVCGLGRGRRREGCDCVAADGRARWCLHPGLAALVNRVGLDSEYTLQSLCFNKHRMILVHSCQAGTASAAQCRRNVGSRGRQACTRRASSSVATRLSPSAAPPPVAAREAVPARTQTNTAISTKSRVPKVGMGKWKVRGRRS